MNKKSLGIAAIALLGVSAAFAATTSTVYFTASGTLTKVVNKLDFITETTTNPNGGEHSSEESKIGVSYVENYFVGNTTRTGSTDIKAYKKYQGSEVTSSESTATACTVEYYSGTRKATGVALGDNESYSAIKPPYVYNEITLSGLTFSKQYDYIVLPIVIYNAESYDMQFVTEASYSYNSYKSYKYDITPTNSYNLKVYLGGNSSSDVIEGYERVGTLSDSADTDKKVKFTANTYRVAYLGISLSADYTTATETEFSSLKITLPSFEKAE